MPFVLTTSILTRKPVVRLLDKNSGRQRAHLHLNSGSLLGAVYAYLDRQDRMIAIDGGKQMIVRITAKRRWGWLGSLSPWKLERENVINLKSTVTRSCGGSNDCDDAIVATSPGPNGSIWFVTQRALVGIYHPNSKSLNTMLLSTNERVDNSFSTTANGKAAIITNKKLYMLSAESLSPKVEWFKEYDHGSSRKPGNLSHGSGSTPTIFGQGLIAITDNADGRINLLVYKNNGDILCQHPIFDDGSSGTENSVIAHDNTIIVSNTHGYGYPALPDGSGPSTPSDAAFVGGMVKLSVDATNADPDRACNIVWENEVRSAAVPKLSTKDGLIYTVELKKDNGLLLDHTHFVAIDASSGGLVGSTDINWNLAADTLQTAGNFGKDGVYWQGDIDGIIRVSPK